MKLLKKLSAATAAVALVLSFAGPMPVSAAATAPSMGAAASFSVLAALSAASANMTTTSGDLGLSPGLAVSRTGPWTVGGTEYFGPLSLAATAQTDAQTAYTNLMSQPSNGVWASASPPPGVWTIALDTTFAGPTLTLNGTASDVWVFQIGQDMTFTGNVVLTGNAQPCNVFWAVGRDTTITAGSHFVGTLIAQRDITLVSGATVNGRVISRTGALTVDANSISGPTCVAPAPPGGNQPATITVIKHVVNDNGGTKVIGDFPLFVNGVAVASGQTNTFPASPNPYTVTETTSANYARTFSGDCDLDGRMNVGSGNNKICIVTNDDIGAPAAVPPVPPIIDVVKVPNPLALPGGPGTVTYTYTLRNIGTVPVTNVTMIDDSCSPLNRISGDSNNNNTLEVNETWTYTCARTLVATNTNIVVATGMANGITATDLATATVVVGAPVVPPLIHVTKVPSVLTLGAGGGNVTYTERITNPGTVPLSNVTLTDDKCGPMLLVSGDTNGDSKLDIAETWTYTCTTRLAATTTNTAVAVGQANGFTVRDFAIVTVVVAAAPILPSTGFGPVNGLIAWSIVAAIGIAASLVLVLRKKQNV